MGNVNRCAGNQWEGRDSFRQPGGRQQDKKPKGYPKDTGKKHLSRIYFSLFRWDQTSTRALSPIYPFASQPEMPKIIDAITADPSPVM